MKQIYTHCTRTFKDGDLDYRPSNILTSIQEIILNSKCYRLQNRDLNNVISDYLLCPATTQ